MGLGHEGHLVYDKSNVQIFHSGGWAGAGVSQQMETSAVVTTNKERLEEEQQDLSTLFSIYYLISGKFFQVTPLAPCPWSWGITWEFLVLSMGPGIPNCGVERKYSGLVWLNSPPRTCWTCRPVLSRKQHCFLHCCAQLASFPVRHYNH